jgi:hypothetical protein
MDLKRSSSVSIKIYKLKALLPNTPLLKLVLVLKEVREDSRELLKRKKTRRWVSLPVSPAPLKAIKVSLRVEVSPRKKETAWLLLPRLSWAKKRARKKSWKTPRRKESETILLYKPHTLYSTKSN